MSDYVVSNELPTSADYIALRVACGLSAKSLQSAEESLPKSVFGVIIQCQGETVGMGRIVGDGGCFLQIVDIAVHPNHQKKGLSRKIMESLMNFIDENVPESAFVSLFADVDYLYQKFGFEATGEKMIGMALNRQRRKNMLNEL